MVAAWPWSLPEPHTYGIGAGETGPARALGAHGARPCDGVLRSEWLAGVAARAFGCIVSGTVFIALVAILAAVVLLLLMRSAGDHLRYGDQARLSVAHISEFASQLAMA